MQKVEKRFNINLDELLKEQKNISKFQYIFIIFLFIYAIFGLIGLYTYFPLIKQEDHNKIFIYPNTIEKLRLMTFTINEYTNTHYLYMIFSFIYLYIIMQTFAIPGPLILSIISGHFWGFYRGFLITSFCATFGSSCCYTISSLFLKKKIYKKWPEKLQKFVKFVKKNENDLFYYFLFLRLTPIFPNILVNLMSPIAGISYTIFIFGTLIGLIPFNIIHVSTGSTIYNATQMGLQQSHILIIFSLAVLSLFPILMNKLYKKKQQLESKIQEQLIY